MKQIAKGRYMKTVELDAKEPFMIEEMPQFMPELCAVKPDGAFRPDGKGDAPSIAFVCIGPTGRYVYVQMSLETIKPAIRRALAMESEQIAEDPPSMNQETREYIDLI